MKTFRIIDQKTGEAADYRGKSIGTVARRLYGSAARVQAEKRSCGWYWTEEAM